MTTPKQDAFIAALLPTARKYEGMYGIAAEAFIAINASETNWGNAQSLFGIKGTGTAGGVSYATWENYGPGAEHTNITDLFAAYKSFDDAYAAFIDFLTSYPEFNRYTPAWSAFQQTKDWRELIRGINRAGYATDPNWANGVIIPLSDTVRSSPAFAAVTPPPPPAFEPKNGWYKEGTFQCFYNAGFCGERRGSSDGQFPFRISKAFGDPASGGKWMWLRMADGTGNRAAYWAEEEGD